MIPDNLKKGQCNMRNSVKFLTIFPVLFLVGCASPPEGRVDFSGPKPLVSGGPYIESFQSFTVKANKDYVLPKLLHTPLKYIFDEGGGLPPIIET